jgi:NAD(P)H-hydrate epimerase
MIFIRKNDLRFKKHDKDSHKGENGRVLVVGGSKDYAGAVALAGIAALRSGADRVVCACPEKVAWAINCLSADLITRKLSGDFLQAKHAKGLVELAKESDAVLIGNGLGMRKQTLAAIRMILKSLKAKVPLVIDADAIKAIRIQDTENAVITPHRKEFEILCINSGIKADPRAVQPVIGSNVVVLKGRIDTVISSGRIICNKTGNEGMTKAGTGDVLAGLCAGFIAQKHGLFQAACNAVYINGAIGDLEKKKRGYGFVASDMLRDITRMKNGTAIF